MVDFDFSAVLGLCLSSDRTVLLYRYLVISSFIDNLSDPDVHLLGHDLAML